MVKRGLAAVLVVLLLLIGCALVQAQETQNPPTPPVQATPEPPAPPPPPEPETIPVFEMYGGYSYFSADPYTVNQRTGLNGGDVGIGLNATRWLDIVADLQINYGSVNIPTLFPEPFPPCTPLCPPGITTFPAHTHTIAYLFGANFPYRRWERVVPFGQFLVGEGHVKGTAYGTGEPQGATVSDTRLAYAFGGGFEYKISPQFAWRTQGDYVVTKFFAHKQDNWRVSSGIVWHVVHKKKKRTLTTP